MREEREEGMDRIKDGSRVRVSPGVWAMCVCVPF
jgi:hypothetical protein